MVFGETGVLLNYIENIEIEENVRYLLFEEKEMQKNETKYGKKTKGCSITDEPILVNIHPNEYSPYKNPIKIIDTAGFDDTRGIEYDEKIENDIKKILEK